MNGGCINVPIYTHTHIRTHMNEFASHFIEFRASMHPLLRRRGANYVQCAQHGYTTHQAVSVWNSRHRLRADMPDCARVVSAVRKWTEGSDASNNSEINKSEGFACVFDMMTIFTRTRLDIRKHTRVTTQNAMMMLMRLMWRV